MSFITRLQHAWSVFANRDPTDGYSSSYVGYSTYYKPDRVVLLPSNEQSIVNSVITRIAIECSSLKIEHVRVDENHNYVETIDDSLNQCLNVEANVDQSGRKFIQDTVLDLLDEGTIAIIPTKWDISESNPTVQIKELRAGKILQWYPDRVQVRLYNEDTGKKEDVIVKKKFAAIVENPLYPVMNAPNSTGRRLIRTQNMLDKMNANNTSGKLDLIIQVPYSFKSPIMKQRAEERHKEIEMQLKDSKYGIGYIDSQEKVVQLNRPLENNLQSQIEYLTTQYYGQLGITDEVMKGTADPQVMQNFYIRTIEPIMAAIRDEMVRKFLSKTARTQGQYIMFWNQPFKYISIDNVGDTFDKLRRNEIITSNEGRGFLGMKPIMDQNADNLSNPNMPEQDQSADSEMPVDENGNPLVDENGQQYEEEIQNGSQEVY